MKSKRMAVTIAYNERKEVEKGVWEDALVEKEIKAEEQYILQRRRDVALLEAKPITYRLRVRENYVTHDLDYVSVKGKKYKVQSVYPEVDSHYCIIELGELV